MSHLPERQQKNCLNCNALVYGRYCHVCGQQNVEPAESFWHLITHFFNDITHFDGKFFSTLRLLITRPGFLSAEYRHGRRANYLNPVKMYVFTSFIFFLIFFTFFKVEDTLEVKIDGESVKVTDLLKLDSTQFSMQTAKLDKNGRPMSYQQFEHYIDSINKGAKISFIGSSFRNKAHFDSMLLAGKVHYGWFEKKLIYRQLEISDKYRYNKRGAMNSVVNTFIHMFPQILFVSLPLFAFFIGLLYARRKQFYLVSHGIYSVHLYIFYFISLLLLMGVEQLEEYYHWSWLNFVTFAIIVGLFIYEYKAMRTCYQQGRAKTMLKFILAVLWRFILFVLLAICFLLFSIYKI